MMDLIEKRQAEKAEKFQENYNTFVNVLKEIPPEMGVIYQEENRRKYSVDFVFGRDSFKYEVSSDGIRDKYGVKLDQPNGMIFKSGPNESALKDRLAQDIVELLS